MLKFEASVKKTLRNAVQNTLAVKKRGGMFLEEAKTKAGLYELLNVPIILLISSVLYNKNEQKTLPERKTELYENFYQFIMNRSTLKPHNFRCYSSEVPNIQSMLQTLRDLHGRLCRMMSDNFLSTR